MCKCVVKRKIDRKHLNYTVGIYRNIVIIIVTILLDL